MSLAVFEKRFHQHISRHPSLSWKEVALRLEKNPEKSETLLRMEETGGEPDVLGKDPKTKTIWIVDFSKEIPPGRRSLCFDKKARLSRKEHPPQNSAEELAKEIGIEILTEELYRQMQAIEALDNKTSSWVVTPANIRVLGGALFCDRRYETVFTYNNGADSYYASRGFRGILRV